MELAMLVAFSADGLVHLYSRLSRRRVLKNVTKALLLIFLLLWYLFAADPVRPIVVAAILFSWTGDLLLIPDGTKWFAAGGVAFMLSHLCFMCSYAAHIRFAELPLWVILLSLAAYTGAVIIIFRELKGSLPTTLYLPMKGYLLINGAMNCFALWQMMTSPCHASAIAYAGGVLFFLSDSLLFYVRFVDKYKNRSHFGVMLTYMLGELLIVFGLILLG